MIIRWGSTNLAVQLPATVCQTGTLMAGPLPSVGNNHLPGSISSMALIRRDPEI